MKKLIYVSLLAFAALLGCQKNDDGGGAAASSSSAFGYNCQNCTNGTSGGVATAQAMSMSYTQTTRFDMQLQSYPTGQVAIIGTMTVLQPNMDTCGLPAGQYPFQMTTGFVSNLILAGGVFQGLPFGMSTAQNSPTISLRPLSNGAYSAYMKIMTPGCGVPYSSTVPFLVNWPGT